MSTILVEHTPEFVVCSSVTNAVVNITNTNVVATNINSNVIQYILENYTPITVGIQGPPGAPSTEGDELVYSKRIDFINDNELYRGEAAVGSIESAAVWRIKKTTIANEGDITEIWAGGNANFDKTWANRVSLSYS